MIYHIIFNKNLNILVHKYNCLIEKSLKIPRRYSEAGISKDKQDIGHSRQNTERQTTEDWPTETPLIMGWGVSGRVGRFSSTSVTSRAIIKWPWHNLLWKSRWTLNYIYTFLFINTKNINIKHETSTKQTAEGGKHEPNTALLGGCRRHLSTEIITWRHAIGQN